MDDGNYYYFLGWATDADATAVEYAVGDEITVDADTVLYAVWEIDPYHDIIAVKITWAAMEFDYYVPNVVWNPDTHGWDPIEGEKAGWYAKDDSNVITLMNYSREVVNATFGYESYHDTVHGLFFCENALVADNVLAMEASVWGVSEITEYAVTFTLAGALPEPDGHAAAYEAIGRITITLAFAEGD